MELLLRRLFVGYGAMEIATVAVGFVFLIVTLLWRLWSIELIMTATAFLAFVYITAPTYIDGVRLISEPFIQLSNCRCSPSSRNHLAGIMCDIHPDVSV